MKKAKDRTQQLPIIGWREILSLPELNVDHVKAKIDTGARSSALHAFHCQEFKLQDRSMIRFQIHPIQHNNQQTILAEAELLEYRKVRNSGGQAQIRPVILTPIKLGEHQWQVELTLTNRDVMGFRMLLGRQAVRNRFLVNPGKSFLQSEYANPYSVNQY
ncbi:RimK/LysX family protein [Pleurocapsa sp. PCC 7319]|uniref:ATP-dependent zinc protease family protein n=1 Tax=Pleurocapsa sp. PCC 7319 TaxID=118161 RepID=UPI000347E0A7|nr:RimK/LysX family protein [Pleurocapsa sp. PCC 7319]